jgi:DNA repair protein RadC
VLFKTWLDVTDWRHILLETSRADEVLTSELKHVLALVEVRVLDHFIVAAQAPPLSFAERGLL